MGQDRKKKPWEKIEDNMCPRKRERDGTEKRNCTREIGKKEGIFHVAVCAHAFRDEQFPSIDCAYIHACVTSTMTLYSLRF